MVRLVPDEPPVNWSTPDPPVIVAVAVFEQSRLMKLSFVPLPRLTT
jgi:hypothetical protein